MGAWRQARAFVLPMTVTIAVPAILLVDEDLDVTFVSVIAGGVLIVAGFSMWLWTVTLFARIGRGTLAPWDPPGRLVVEGPYRLVRNPMISAVLTVLLGEAALFASVELVIWAAGFFAANALFFVLYEEPGLERRFGEDYRAYRRTVPRWVPTLRARGGSRSR